MASMDSTEGPLKTTLEAYRGEYRELSENWRHLDGKAQGTVAIAGIFLAAGFAFVRATASLPQSAWARIILVAAVILLVTSVLLAVLALRVREVAAAPLGAELEKLTADLLKLEDEQERAARAPNLLWDQIQLWRLVNEQVHKKNNDKADLVLKAQLFLLLSIGAVATLVVLIIVGWV